MQNINTKLEYWKNRLLDMGKRNRLISLPLPKDGKRVQRNSLLIGSPAPNDVWSMLHDGDAALSFPIPITTDEDDSDSILEEFYSTAGVQTNQSQKETQKTLRAIMRKAKEFSEEKGLNALHVAFGFLNWVDKGTEGDEMRSPLLLLPVKLTQDDLFSPIILSRSDEELTSNFSLEQRLLNDFGVELPELDEDTELSEYLFRVEQTVKPLGWSVSNDVVQLSLFSFMKINMFQDIERNTGGICNHPLIRVLNGEALNDFDDMSDITGYDHDNTEPNEVFSVVDADSSQQDAILLAKRGVSFVLQGPPGTGKSQTITNIIAELITDGKKVLFVSEKMAALEVVYKRLTQVGLADFCLTLHSHNAKRREILDQLNNSVKMSRNKLSIQQDAYNRLHRLKEVRCALNNYSKELHTVVEPLGKTIYQVNGYLSQYESHRNIDYIQKNADKFSPELLSQCESALEEVTRIVSESGYQQNNPWNGCILTQPPTFEFRQRFAVDADLLISQLNEGINLFEETNEMLGISYDYSLADIALIKQIYDCAKESPGVSESWISIDIEKALIDIDECVDSLNALNNLKATIRHLEIECESIQQTLDSETKLQLSSEFFADRVIAYNDAYDSYKDFTAQKNNCETDKSAAIEKYELLKDSLSKEEAFCQEKSHEWLSSRDNILKNYDEDVLTLDIPNMLVRYRTDYRSFFQRMGKKYKTDNKSLLAYRKSAGKQTYEEELLSLDLINDAFSKKEAYYYQYNNTRAAEELVRSSENDVNNISRKLIEVSASLTSAKSQLSIEHNQLVSSIGSYKDKTQLEKEKRESALHLCFQSLQNTLILSVNEETVFPNLKANLEWCLDFSKFVQRHPLGSRFIKEVCNRDETLQEEMNENIRKLFLWRSSIAPGYEKFISLFSNITHDDFEKLKTIEILMMVTQCKENYAGLEYLIDYRIAEKRLTGLGIDAFLANAKELALTSDEIIPVFKKCFYRSWLDIVVQKFNTIQEFRRLRHDERIESFKNLDRSHLEISKAIVTKNLISRLPNFDAFSSSGEIALLRREMAKQRKLMPTRLLIAALPNLLPALKPCVMMSPLSVSTYLGSSNYQFDTVLFDEASQVRTEDAISSIFRANQVIIAGDSKQLPPTEFFMSSISTSDDFEEDEDGDIDDTGAYDSLLDEATILPSQTLLWHYRSRHEDLIAFSNAKIYHGNLITFPSSVQKQDGMGVEYIHVVGGTYNRGGKNGNRAEAKKVADLVFEHLQTYPQRSLGIIAFGEVQQTAIQDALIEKRQANPKFEPFFKDDLEENLFIKNLETVQGDERDTIIFSIGYAPDEAGKFLMNFGPLSRDGGERRLNVAVTRARYNIKLVGSILPTDIDTDRISKQGPKLLRLYIDYAINGSTALLGEVSEYANNLWFDSPFEESVHDFLTNNGYEVATQVGCSGYRIDMAVRHPKYNGRFAIGIECDGAMYHSARTARERDRLRQTVLEDMGWTIYRIWSTDWIKDRHTEGARLLAAVNNTVENYREVTPKTNVASVKMTDFIEVDTQTSYEKMREGIQQKFAVSRSRYYGWQAKEIPYNDIIETMRKTNENNFGLDKAGLFKETALYGYGWERLGQVIKKRFEQAYTELIRQGAINEKPDILEEKKEKFIREPKKRECPSCGVTLDKTDVFCGQCGSKSFGDGSKQTELQRICRKCGAGYDTVDTFCGKCGSQI